MFSKVTSRDLKCDNKADWDVGVISQNPREKKRGLCTNCGPMNLEGNRNAKV